LDGVVTWSLLYMEPARFAWLAFPVVVAALVHVLVLRFRWLDFLRIPLDAGATWRGRRVFGSNKTVRGAIVMIGVSILVAALQGMLRVPTLEYFDYGAANMPLIGLLMGLGFVVGELPNSLVKRQLGVAPGSHAGVWHTLADQLDSVVGALLMLALVWVPPLRVWVVAVVLGTGLHMAVNGLFVVLGLKRSIF
jgi:hypothetical protein